MLYHATGVRRASSTILCNQGFLRKASVTPGCLPSSRWDSQSHGTVYPNRIAGPHWDLQILKTVTQGSPEMGARFDAERCQLQIQRITPLLRSGKNENAGPLMERSGAEIASVFRTHVHPVTKPRGWP